MKGIFDRAKEIVISDSSSFSFKLQDVLKADLVAVLKNYFVFDTGSFEVSLTPEKNGFIVNFSLKAELIENE